MLMAPGTRVTMTSWGKATTGTVVDHLIPSVVFVVWDGTSKKVWIDPRNFPLTTATGGTP